MFGSKVVQTPGGAEHDSDRPLHTPELIMTAVISHFVRHSICPSPLHARSVIVSVGSLQRTVRPHRIVDSGNQYRLHGKGCANATNWDVFDTLCNLPRGCLPPTWLSLVLINHHMDDDRHASNPAGLAFNRSLVTGGVFNVYLPSQGRVGCRSEMNQAENPTAGLAAGTRFSGLDRVRGTLSY